VLLPEKLGEVCGPLPKTFTPFMTKICDISYPVYDLTLESKPCLGPEVAYSPSYDFELDFELDFRVRISSWIFELGFRVGFSSKDVESVFLLVIQLQRIGQFVSKPSRRFPVQYSQQKNSCRGGVNVLPFIARKQLHLNHVVPQRPKGGINLYIEFEKHKLHQIAARNKRMFLEKRIAFSK